MTFFNAVDQVIDQMEGMVFSCNYCSTTIISTDFRIAALIGRELKKYIDNLLTTSIACKFPCLVIDKTPANSIGNSLKPECVLAIRKVVNTYRKILTSKHQWKLSEDEKSKEILKIKIAYSKHENWLPNFNWDGDQNLLLENTSQLPVYTGLSHIIPEELNIAIFPSWSCKSSTITDRKGTRSCSAIYAHPEPRIYVYGNPENLSVFFKILKKEASNQNSDKIKMGPCSLQKLACKKIASNWTYYEKEFQKILPEARTRLKLMIIKTSSIAKASPIIAMEEG